MGLQRAVVRASLAVLLGFGLAFGGLGAETAQAQEEAVIEGFRSAKFGMNETQLRAAILKDFGKGNKDINETVTAERTKVLTVETEDLLPGSGKSVIAYILGFQSKELTTVNVLWGNSVDREATEVSVRSSAQTLLRYFSDFGFDPTKVVGNRAVNQNTVLLFRGEDAEGKVVQMLFSEFPLPGTQENAAQSGNQEGEGQPKGHSLQLSYVLDPENPDIFRIEKGLF